LLVQPGNVAKLGEALGRLINDASLRRCLASRAREVFAQKFSPEVFTEALGATYAELGFMP
jgi:glycosyltransferase involved in cell wall biosynthesis